MTDVIERARAVLTAIDQAQAVGVMPARPDGTYRRVIADLLAEVERLRKLTTWPKTTPTGHLYSTPSTYEELRSRHTDAAQAHIESWTDAECPPEPTWEMVGLAHRRVKQLADERNEALAAIGRVRELLDDFAPRPGRR